MAITVTIAPCRTDRVPNGRMRLPMQLLEIAQAMSDDCDVGRLRWRTDPYPGFGRA